MRAEDARSAAPRGAGWRRMLPLGAIAVVAVAGAVALRDVLSFEALARHREALLAIRDANYALAVAAFMAAYVAVVAFSLPGALVMTLTGGFLFGLFPGALVNPVAATIGATGIFLAARHGLGDRLAARIEAAGGAAQRLRDGIRADETSYLLTMRLVPVVPFFVANLVPAVLGVATGKFVVTTLLGILPGAVVYTWVGAGLGEVFAQGGTPDLGIIFAPQVLGPILGLAALALLPVVVKRVRRS